MVTVQACDGLMGVIQRTALIRPLIEQNPVESLSMKWKARHILGSDTQRSGTGSTVEVHEIRKHGTSHSHVYLRVRLLQGRQDRDAGD